MKILVVGASGRMGSLIVRELQAAGADVLAPRRPELDLTDDASLDRLCAGVEVIVSAVQGGRDVIVDGQTRLLRAAERAGVKRMIPSDYSVDFFKTIEGQNRNLDLRREFNGVLDGSTVRGTSVLCGMFMDLLVGGAGPDPKTGAYRFFGDPDQPYDFTLTEDVARYIAAVALDADPPRVVRVAGDTLSPRQVAAVFEELRGVAVPLAPAGSLDMLDELIERMRAADTGAEVFPIWQRLQYARDMASGRGRLSPLDNGRYPGVHPTTVRALLQQQR